MTTVMELAISPNIEAVVVDSYDHASQTRGISMGYFTANTLQTFNFQGQPTDAQGDNND